jgi:hypothetical protein
MISISTALIWLCKMLDHLYGRCLWVIVFTQFWFQNMFSGLQATPENMGHVRTIKIGKYKDMWDKRQNV